MSQRGQLGEQITLGRRLSKLVLVPEAHSTSRKPYGRCGGFSGVSLPSCYRLLKTQTDGYFQFGRNELMHVKFEPLLRTGQPARVGAPLLYVLNNLRAVALFRRSWLKMSAVGCTALP